MRQILELEQRRLQGQTLNSDQLAKIATRSAIEAEIQSLAEPLKPEHTSTMATKCSAGYHAESNRVSKVPTSDVLVVASCTAVEVSAESQSPPLDAADVAQAEQR